MRFRLLLLCLPPLLAACSKTATPVRLDFIGATGLTSGNRTVGPADTLVTRAYAEGNDNRLKQLRITVKYEPTRNPIVYPSPITSYDPGSTPNDDELVFADSLINPTTPGSTPSVEGLPRGGAFLFTNRFTARTTSGTERWQYTASDETQASATRAFRLTVRNPDSARVYHGYTLQLAPVIRVSNVTPDYVERRDRARVFLNLRSGLQLPKYSLINNSRSLLANQPLVDLICVAKNATTVILCSPDDSVNLQLNDDTWPPANRRNTQLVATSLGETEFTNAATATALDQAFAAGIAYSNSRSTTPLQKGQVIAFRMTEGNSRYTGLLLVSDIVLGSSPRVVCRVRVQK